MELIGKRPFRILDFDTEARPLSWYGGDFVTKEITAIACKWIGEDSPVAYWLIGIDDPETMLITFHKMYYSHADMVTGHFIRGYDLPVLNGALSEYGLPLLEDKLTQDTKLDLVKRSGMSNSQENLAAMLGVESPKIPMDQAKWRASNRLTLRGIGYTKERVIGDVLQHIEMRQKMLDLKMLGTPKVWTGTPSGTSKYHG